MYKKIILSVALSALIICIAPLLSLQLVSANAMTIEIEEYSMYPYLEVKQEAIKSLKKAENTLNWDDITDAWIKVDGLTMHPDYDGDSEAKALYQKVDDLFDKFANQKNYEVNDVIESQPTPNTTATIYSENKSKPIVSTNDKENRRRIIKVEEKVTTKTIPASQWNKYALSKTTASTNSSSLKADVSEMNLDNKNSSTPEVKKTLTELQDKINEEIIADVNKSQDNDTSFKKQYSSGIIAKITAIIISIIKTVKSI